MAANEIGPSQEDRASIPLTVWFLRCCDLSVLCCLCVWLCFFFITALDNRSRRDEGQREGQLERHTLPGASRSHKLAVMHECAQEHPSETAPEYTGARNEKPKNTYPLP